jgi:hypothetical protein
MAKKYCLKFCISLYTPVAGPEVRSSTCDCTARGYEREDYDVSEGQDVLRFPANSLREATNRIAKVQGECFFSADP